MSKLNTGVNKLEEKTDSSIDVLKHYSARLNALELHVFHNPSRPKIKGKIFSKGHALSLWYEIYSLSRSSWKFVGCKTVLVCH